MFIIASMNIILPQMSFVDQSNVNLFRRGSSEKLVRLWGPFKPLTLQLSILISVISVKQT
jgi:hypothetical protein